MVSRQDGPARLFARAAGPISLGPVRQKTEPFQRGFGGRSGSATITVTQRQEDHLFQSTVNAHLHRPNFDDKKMRPFDYRLSTPCVTIVQTAIQPRSQKQERRDDNPGCLLFKTLLYPEFNTMMKPTRFLVLATLLAAAAPVFASSTISRTVPNSVGGTDPRPVKTVATPHVTSSIVQILITLLGLA
jgi:hypothetical protein